MLSGRFVDGERLAVTAMEVGISAGHDEAAMLHFGGQLGLLRELQGRRRDLIVPVEEAVEEFPALVAWRCALTALYACHDRPGRPGEARSARA